jgi:hypothetical protein
MALASDGSLFTWGDGRYGQLGHAQLQMIAQMMPNQAVVMPVPAKVTRLVSAAALALPPARLPCLPPQCAGAEPPCRQRP